jgi:hypothetical protein
MTTRIEIQARVLVVMVLIACCGGCVAMFPRDAWIVNGQRVGTIQETRTAYGMERRYIDSAKRLQRLEKLDRQANLLPGASVELFVYNPDGSLAEERFHDVNMTPMANEEGYAIKRHAYSVNAAGDRVDAQSFFDASDRPASTTSGYAYLTQVQEGSTGAVKEVILENAQHQPAYAIWDGLGGISRAKYVTLEGIGAVRCAAYCDPTGRVTSRKVLSGTCYYSASETTVTSGGGGGPRGGYGGGPRGGGGPRFSGGPGMRR